MVNALKAAGGGSSARRASFRCSGKWRMMWSTSTMAGWE
jgi:hypothetical protein